jgi:glycosyltransferase involved in cell wall biosynthesis
VQIVLIAPPWIPVPPPAYGGVEAVVDRLARGLQDAGHDVLLVGHPASRCPVPRESVVEDVERVPIGEVVHELTHVVGAYAHAEGADVVHDHTCGGPMYGSGHVDVPIVATNHGPFDQNLTAIYRAVADRVALVAISHAQARSTSLPAHVIHHGVDLADFPEGAGRGGYLLFLGRMTPAKGVHLAVDAARRAGRPLVIAAKMREAAEHEYFARFVEPLLGDDARYIGEADEPTKLALLGDAEALLNPIVWPEPFGMVMLEALACGTPVVGFANGAAPEIVDHGQTGWLVRDGDLNGLVKALRRVARLDRDGCRAAVAARFSVERMVDGHVDLYEQILSSTGRHRGVAIAAAGS